MTMVIDGLSDAESLLDRFPVMFRTRIPVDRAIRVYVSSTIPNQR